MCVFIFQQLTQDRQHICEGKKRTFSVSAKDFLKIVNFFLLTDFTGNGLKFHIRWQKVSLYPDGKARTFATDLKEISVLRIGQNDNNIWLMSFLTNLALKQCDLYLFIPAEIRVDNLKVA